MQNHIPMAVTNRHHLVILSRKSILYFTLHYIMLYIIQAYIVYIMLYTLQSYSNVWLQMVTALISWCWCSYATYFSYSWIKIQLIIVSHSVVWHYVSFSKSILSCSWGHYQLTTVFSIWLNHWQAQRRCPLHSVTSSSNNLEENKATPYY